MNLIIKTSKKSNNYVRKVFEGLIEKIIVLQCFENFFGLNGKILIEHLFNLKYLKLIKI